MTAGRRVPGERAAHALAVLRTIRAVLAAGLVAGLVGGCGTPDYRYAANADDGVYLKVPSSWNRVDQDELDRLATAGLDAQSAATVKASTWSVAFDADQPASAQHLVAADLRRPVAYARVIQVPPGARAGVTVDALRDVFVPVTESARVQASAAGTSLGPFTMVRTSRAAPKGLTGVHQVFSYGTGASRQVFDQTSWTNRDRSRLYLLLVRCSTACYAQRRDELAQVVKSFTVDRSGTS